MAIQVKNLNKSFGENNVFNNLTLEIKKGEIVSIIGPSGKGKSTFLRCLIGLEELGSGEIICNRKKMGMVFQSFNLFPNMTVLKNITIAPVKVKNINEKEAAKTAMELLKKVGLSDKANDLPEDLSGGEQQRVAIARAIVNRPSVLIADEPTGNLDPDTSKDIVDLFKHINNFGTTVIMVTHNMDLVSYLNKRVIRLKDGRVQSDNMRGAEINEA